MVVFDADFLILLLQPDQQLTNPTTKEPLTRVPDRFNELLKSLQKRREKIIVPTPALSEVLVLVSDRANDYLMEIINTYGFEIASFDTRAAIEAAIAAAAAKQRGDKKGGSKETWAKIKFDRQIVAIAKVKGATAIYSKR
jgi:hypothetical protein